MATCSTTLAWRIPWTEEPGGLQSTGLHRVGHDRSDLAAAAADTVTREILIDCKLLEGTYLDLFLFLSSALKSQHVLMASPEIKH